MTDFFGSRDVFLAGNFKLPRPRGWTTKSIEKQ